MDALTFIASLIRSLAWPGVVVFFVWYFAQPLAELLLTVSRFRYKDLEVDFGKEIREVKASAEKALPPVKEAEVRAFAGVSAGRRFEDLAKIDPAAAVLVAWREVERALSEAAQRFGLIKPLRGLLGIALNLRLLGKIDQPTYSIFAQLQRLRHQAVLGGGFAAAITESEAGEFAELATRLAAKIDKA